MLKRYRRCTTPVRACLVLSALCLRLPATAQQTLDFETWPGSPPNPAGFTEFSDANDGGTTYQGVNFTNNFQVVGTNSQRNGTIFANPRGTYALTNRFGGDRLLLLTNQVLQSVYFGRSSDGGNPGANRVTVSALANDVILGSASIDLIDPNDPNSLTLRKLDTSGFNTLSGITGYYIDRQEQNAPAFWVADDFTFAPAGGPDPAVPAPPGLITTLLGLIPGVSLLLRRRGRR